MMAPEAGGPVEHTAAATQAAAAAQAGGARPPASGIMAPPAAAASMAIPAGFAGHPALAQMQAAVAQQAMAQAAAQAAAAGVVLPPSVQAQLQQQQQHFAAAAAAAAGQPRQAAPSQAPSAPQGPAANGVDHVSQKNRGDDWAPESLFGGAMEMELPLRFNDISNFHHVPDHQEVFADAMQDQSLVVEILEMAQVEDARSAHYFFEDLAVQNEAESSAMETVYTLTAGDVPHLPPNSVCTCALGYQTIAKGRQAPDTSNYVQIILGVVRLPQVRSDIVISLNTPAYINEKNSAAEHVGSGPKTSYIRAPEMFRRMLQSFRILDMGLFGSS